MASTIARVLQLSDLHFGVPGQLEVWRKLVDFVRQQLEPEAILLTGDIVDTPRTRLFKLAAAELDALCKPYRAGGRPVQLVACPGNHDRFYRGNRFGVPWPIGKQFEYYFGQYYMKQQTAVKLKGLISLEVTSIDTTENVRFFARGAVSKATRDRLSGTGVTMADGHERSLRVLLMHHHLLPIAELEPDADRDQLLHDFFRPFIGATTMVANAGRVLDCLSRGRFDLVLHGHEHAFNLARFNAVTEDSLPMTIVSAPSSTGVVTGRPCDCSRSRLNVLELDADETLWLNAFEHDAQRQTWISAGRRLLMSDMDLRRAWFCRSPSAARPDSGGRTLFEHTVDFDVRVLRTHCELEVPPGQVLSPRVSSTAGSPSDLQCRYIKDGIAHEVPGLGFVDDLQRNTFVAHIPLPDLAPGTLLDRLVIQYVWKGNSDMTASRIARRPENERDYFSRRGMECVFTGMQRKRAAWYEVSVVIPLAYAPCGGLGGVQAYVQREGEPEPALSESLTRKIVPSGDGHYTLRIAYPDVHTKYFLAWPAFDDLGGVP